MEGNHKKTHLQDLNVEATKTGEPARILRGDCSTANGIENKDGAFRKEGDQGCFDQVFVTKELGEPVVIGHDVQGNYNQFVNCHGWPAEDSGATTSRGA